MDEGPYSERSITRLGESPRDQSISGSQQVYEGRSYLPSGRSSKPYRIDWIKRTPKSLFGGALLVDNHISHKSSTFRLGTSGYAGSLKSPRRYISYIGAICGDSPQRDRQWLTKMRRVWYTLTTPAMINVRTNNSKH
ncbi:hypothetical protein PIB30_067125 [Stylosanthes scabra]|uniref:Uncharacterized protein n=1 Tax=Stylosanthes scabra TaxID=79078 RepID=A0ABU6TN79_9FABA|nr:hypothetical protein [Stylosanthes scabra]